MATWQSLMVWLAASVALGAAGALVHRMLRHPMATLGDFLAMLGASLFFGIGAMRVGTQWPWPTCLLLGAMAGVLSLPLVTAGASLLLLLLNLLLGTNEAEPPQS